MGNGQEVIMGEMSVNDGKGPVKGRRNNFTQLKD